MKRASIREVRHDLNRVLAWVANGEEVIITRRRETVARLLPMAAKKKLAKKPDMAARLKKVFGMKMISSPAIKEIWDQNRRDY